MRSNSRKHDNIGFLFRVITTILTIIILLPNVASDDTVEEVYIATGGDLGKLCLSFNAKTAADGARIKCMYCYIYLIYLHIYPIITNHYVFI